MKVAVVVGGTSPEAEISRRSGKAVADALRDIGYDVSVIELDRNLPIELDRLRPGRIFLALHGCPGEDGTVQGLLDILGYKYTGCGVESSAICMDKDITKRVLKTYGITVPSGLTFFRGDEIFSPEFPCVVKPARAGSTVGISIVRDKKNFNDAVEKAFGIDTKVIVEEYIPGREITVPVLNGKALPIVEVVAETGFYDFSAKYEKPTTRYIVPAEIKEITFQRLHSISEKVYKVLECRGAIRIDFRLNENGIPYLLEVNSIPGMTEHSLLPKSATAAGISFEKLIGDILDSQS